MSLMAMFGWNPENITTWHTCDEKYEKYDLKRNPESSTMSLFTLELLSGRKRATSGGGAISRYYWAYCASSAQIST
jgi:hypothetical protein